GEDVRLRLREGLTVKAVDYLAARERRPRLIAAVNELFTEVDVLLGPTVPTHRRSGGAAERRSDGRSPATHPPDLALQHHRPAGDLAAVRLHERWAAHRPPARRPRLRGGDAPAPGPRLRAGDRVAS